MRRDNSSLLAYLSGPLFWGPVLAIYIVFRQWLGETGMALMRWGMLVVGIALFALRVYIGRHLDSKQGDYEETDAWFGKTLKVHQVRARLLGLTGISVWSLILFLFLWLLG